jgi:hypothetical protein
MARIFVFDSGPAGQACDAPTKPNSIRLNDWLTSAWAGGALIVLPEIVDYEVRRELIRIGAVGSIRRLDEMQGPKGVFDYAPLTTAVMRRAASLWAEIRLAGMGTADPKALDGDVILAAQALEFGGVGDVLTVITSNPGHLVRYVPVGDWSEVRPDR